MRGTLLLLGVALLAGCGGAMEEEPFVPARAAEPQQAELGWRETYPAGPKRLVFEVHRLVVRAEGWTAEISVTNETGVAFRTGDATDQVYGLMLFDNGELEQLQRDSEAGTLPPVRKAAEIAPAPPRALRPGATWRATLAAPGALADGSYVRVAFGPFEARGEPPRGMEPVVFWITDRSHRL